ncbi:DEAD/DEAH box helicase [Alcanivorax jadensis]|uniref:DEAD/DEAH box helicase n=1 Tax=Alcanivorax jadensis TaxID=64988 RepID=UPI00240A8BC6|nr:DEAD/DEAH box helicase [Alcanivorax jadensis]MDF1639126.1 DEAD/DEAH box helicase [Alcanivorax jadensis]
MAAESLSFEEKSQINRRLIDAMRLSLMDKEKDVIPWPGKIYHEIQPYQKTLAGTIGYAPNPEFDGVQPPNAMGMTLLVTPDKNGRIELLVSGQFDVCIQQIPNLELQRQNLKKEGGDPKPSQEVYPSFRRITVQFTDVPIEIDVSSDLNMWVKPGPGNSLASSLRDLQARWVDDPRVYKVPVVRERGYAKYDFVWPEGGEGAIADQDEFNEIVRRDVFARLDATFEHDIGLRSRLRKAPASLSDIPGAFLLETFIENNTSRDVARAFGLDSNAFLFDVRFNIKLTAGDGHMLPHKLAPKDYRYKENDGVPGYGITTSVEQIGLNHYGTDALPVSGLERIKNPSPHELGMSEEPAFELLSDNPIPALKELVEALDTYLDDWQAHIDAMASSGQVEESRYAKDERKLLLAERQNINDGVALLKQHPDLLQSFKWMNEAMLRAFQHQGKHIATWRLFQIGFILTQVRAIYERCCPESELTDHLDTAEVLWFATGGGKTEAYMGIIIMAMFYERMNQRLYGPTAWLKFPLRMLSVQQFQRLSYAVAQANIIKVREGARLEGHPFTIGYFTGDGAPGMISPGYMEDSPYYLPKIDEISLHKLRFISDCPYCDEVDSIRVVKDLSASRLKHVCKNDQCWSNTTMPAGSYGEGTRGEIGIYVSDEEVYRFLPTVLVGTIDKLSVIGHNKRFKALLGHAPYFCPVHGFTAGTKCEHARLERDDTGTYVSNPCGNNTRTSSIKVVESPQSLKAGVSFVLQDEIHLLSENTGNFAAHYESTMRTLQTAMGSREPKILGATATIKGFEHHINHLYQKRARRFPSPGMKRGESFYSRVETNDKGEPLIQRWYVGMLPVGAGRIMQRSSALASAKFLDMIDDWCKRLRSEPEGICEMTGIAPSRAGLLLEYIETYLNTCLIYSNSMNDNTDIHRALDEFQFGQDRIYEHLDGNSSLEEIQAIIRKVEVKAPDDPFRQIVATSMVSHGVDIHRLNFMVMAGWPKSISEYLQASARAGRVEPGIVLNVLNSKTLFQTNVFLDFQDYHRFMDRMVESVPVNRFAPNLLNRTLPGVTHAAILNWLTQQPGCSNEVLKNTGKLSEKLRDPSSGLQSNLRAVVKEALTVPEAAKPFFDRRVLAHYESQLERAVEKIITGLALAPSSLATVKIPEAIERLLGSRPMVSFRDIEVQIAIKPNENDADDLLSALGDR